MICHITDKADWDTAKSGKYYTTESLSKEGFIHCSPVEKIPEVADKFYNDQKNLVILCIDELKVESKIVTEDLYGHAFEFPHIYGPLNTDAVVKVVDFPCRADGSLNFPEGI